MRHFRRWLALPLLMTAALLMCGSVRSQTPDKQDDKAVKSETKAKSPQTDDAKDKTISDLKKTVEGLQKDIDGAKKSVTELNSSVADSLKASAKSLDDLKAASTLSGTKADATDKTIATVQQSIADAKVQLESIKGMEEKLKAVDEIKKTADTANTAAGDGKSKGDTAWMLMSTALVMFMLPGLALFYGGMVRRRNVLATMMQSMACLAVVGLYWIGIGYALAFGPSAFSVPEMMGMQGGGVLGWSWDLVFLQNIATDQKLPGYEIPVYVHAMFQGMFAIITPALISGAIAERIRFWPFCIFVILWITFVYCPLAHMVWAFDFFNEVPADAKKKLGETAIGFLGANGVLDFAGGTVVHIAAGMAGLACCLVLRRRNGYPKTVIHPNSMVLTLLGAGMLWFGWFGFNGGSATNSSPLAGSAFAATQAAAAAAGLGWIFIEWLLKGKPTALGLASGIVAGLVAVTPASGFVYIWGGVAIGLIAAVVCYLAVAIKNMLGYDDSLDAFGVHGVGGFVGAVLTGLLCSTAVNSAGADGFFAMRYQKAHLVELESTLIPAAEKGGKETEEKATKLKDELKTLRETIEKQTTDNKGPFTQFIIQLKAAGFAVVFAFVVSLLLAALTQAMTLGNFRTNTQDEMEGLDQTEHGETGFDLGYATESITLEVAEPRSATSPKPQQGRFDLVIEGVAADEISKVWTSLCKPTDKPAPADFVQVYKSVTTFSGNRFRCRGTDAPAVATRMESLFKKLLPGKPIKVVRI